MASCWRWGGGGEGAQKRKRDSSRIKLTAKREHPPFTSALALFSRHSLLRSTVALRPCTFCLKENGCTCAATASPFCLQQCRVINRSCSHTDAETHTHTHSGFSDCKLRARSLWRTGLQGGQSHTFPLPPPLPPSAASSLACSQTSLCCSKNKIPPVKLSERGFGRLRLRAGQSQRPKREGKGGGEARPPPLGSRFSEITHETSERAGRDKHANSKCKG